MRDADSGTVYRSFVSASGFFYEHAPRLVVVSVAWFVCSLPIVTVGPATLAGYAAVLSLHEEGAGFDYERIVAALRHNGLSAALLTGVPLTFALVAALYARAYLLSPGTATLALAVASAYAAVYVALVLVPTFVELVRGEELARAVRTGARWTVSNAVGAVTMAMATLVVCIATALLTVAFPLVFAGFAFAFHLDVLLERESEDGDDADSVYASVRQSESEGRE